MDIRVMEAPFDAGEVLSSFQAQLNGAGAMVSFTGIVRDTDRGDLEAMKIEHYPGMTESALTQIAEDAKARWDLNDLLVIHRYGRLVPGEVIMMVATASRHRKSAFEAADFMMDYLKSRAPFWKKEITHSGAEWVASKEDDEAALASWTTNSKT